MGTFESALGVGGIWSLINCLRTKILTCAQKLHRHNQAEGGPGSLAFPPQYWEQEWVKGKRCIEREVHTACVKDHHCLDLALSPRTTWSWWQRQSDAIRAPWSHDPYRNFFISRRILDWTRDKQAYISSSDFPLLYASAVSNILIPFSNATFMIS